MVRLKLVLDKRRKLKTGHYPLKLKFSVNQKIWYKSIGITLEPRYWNTTLSQLRQNHPNWQVLNLQLIQIINQHQKEIIECSLNKEQINITDIRSLYKACRDFHFFFSFIRNFFTFIAF